jgi:Flp pilus assembly protein TadG
MLHEFRSFAKNEAGSLISVFALSLLAIMNFMILAIDYMQAIRAKNEMKMVLDSAALSALNHAVRLIETNDGDKIKYSDLTEQANALIDANLSGNAAVFKDFELTFSYEDNEAVIAINYNYDINLFFGTVSISASDFVQAEATVNADGAYLDIQLLLDYSSSMSTGATQNDQIAMWKTQNCSFACHQSNVQDAHSAGIQLRQDKLIEAVNLLIDLAEEGMEKNDLVEDASQFTIRRFNTNLFLDMASTTDLDDIRSAVDSLPATPSGSTDLSNALTTLGSQLPKSGRGSSEDDRRTFLFLVTDGMADTGNRINKSSGGRGTLDPSECAALKQKGITVAIIYTEYEDYSESYKSALGTSNNDYSYWVGHYNTYVRNPNNNMEDALRACASNGFYFQSSNPAELNEAMEDFFTEAVKATKGGLRLTR